jgi:hypothetical protein
VQKRVRLSKDGERENRSGWVTQAVTGLDMEQPPPSHTRMSNEWSLQTISQHWAPLGLMKAGAIWKQGAPGMRGKSRRLYHESRKSILATVDLRSPRAAIVIFRTLFFPWGG